MDYDYYCLSHNEVTFDLIQIITGVTDTSLHAYLCYGEYNISGCYVWLDLPSQSIPHNFRQHHTDSLT